MSPLLLLGIGVLILIMLGAGVALIAGGRGRQVGQRLEEFVGDVTTAPAGVLTMPAPTDGPDVADRLDKAISHKDFAQKIKDRLAKADLKLRVSEYIGLQIASTLGGAVAGYLLFDHNTFLAVGGLFVGYRVLPIYTDVAASRRLRAFDSQLSDTLNLWVNALRSGYSVLQGMEAIATELPPPVSKEFERVVQEMRLGLSMYQSLNNLLRRLPSEDLDLVVTALNVQREVGGNLAEILDIISYTIRERVRIKGEIRTLTAQGRFTGWVISLLPVALTLVLYKINPSYMGQIFDKAGPWILPEILPCGWIAVGLGLLLIGGGIVAVRKIVTIEI